MQYIQRDRLIHIEWSIFRGTSDVPEDFSRALVKMFLIGNNEKYLLTATAQGGTLLADLPEGLPEGAYSLEALWVKNYGNLLPHRQPLTPGGEPVCLRRPGQRPNAHAFLHPHDHRFNDRCLMRSRKDYVFALTDYPSEETYTGDSGEATVRCASSVATYGYDGLSAYQIAVMRGDFNGTEGEYLESLKYELEAATDEKLGGIKASAKTDNETVEAKIGPDGKLYVPAAASEELKAATETTLGGIRAATKTSLETQEVKIDPETGKLYTLPGGEGGVEIVNNPDDEDLHSVEKSQDEHVLQFADKEYNASAFSGLGRVYLRKNLSSGKNVLTQAMMNKANTRYIIQYDYDLDGGTIEVPEGCTFDFQGGSLGNGTVVLNKTKLSGRIRFALNCNFTGKSSNNELNVEWFGAVGDGETDSTQAFKNVLKIAYNSLENTGNSYNKRSAVINIGVGSYKVINSIIDEDSELLYGAFLFKGQGYVSSIIKYEGDANTYLFDNKNIFAYTSFKDIGFLGNNENNFMHLYSAGDPNITQSIIFDRVRFGSFKTLMNAEGSTMCSEVNFINCKIVGFSESSVIFIMNNLNAVNWRFWGTEIEQTNGVVFRLLKGSFISLYSGSFIPFKGTFIEVPEEADNATFWYTNSPQVCMYSCRFELRGLSKLLSVRNPAYLGFSFYSCNMGGSNITEEADTYQIEALSNNSRNQLRIHFVDCANFENYKMKSVADESSYAYFTELTFDRCIINIDEFISSMYCTNINNSEGYPKVYIDGVLYIMKLDQKDTLESRFAE